MLSLSSTHYSVCTNSPPEEGVRRFLLNNDDDGSDERHPYYIHIQYV